MLKSRGWREGLTCQVNFPSPGRSASTRGRRWRLDRVLDPVVVRPVAGLVADRLLIRRVRPAGAVPCRIECEPASIAPRLAGDRVRLAQAAELLPVGIAVAVRLADGPRTRPGTPSRPGGTPPCRSPACTRTRRGRRRGSRRSCPWCRRAGSCTARCSPSRGHLVTEGLQPLLVGHGAEAAGARRAQQQAGERVVRDQDGRLDVLDEVAERARLGLRPRAPGRAGSGRRDPDRSPCRARPTRRRSCG